MTIAQIEAETIRIMFANAHDTINDSLVGELSNDPTYSIYMSNMPGAINRCLNDLEIKRVLPVKSYSVSREHGTVRGRVIRFDLPALIGDYYDIDRVVLENDDGYQANAPYRREGDVLVLPEAFVRNSTDTELRSDEYTVLYRPSIPKILSTTDINTEIGVPDNIAVLIPFYIKGDLYRSDEADEANEARNWYEQGIEAIRSESDKRSGCKVIECAYDMTEL